MDRPAVRSGRLPTGPNEAVLTTAAAEAEGLGIGDVVNLAFWRQEIPHTFIGDAYEAFMNEVVSPIGVEQVEVVGIVTLADEVLPDDLYPRQRVIVSPASPSATTACPPRPHPVRPWPR